VCVCVWKDWGWGVFKASNEPPTSHLTKLPGCGPQGAEVDGRQDGKGGGTALTGEGGKGGMMGVEAGEWVRKGYGVAGKCGCVVNTS
jgi:hypothetical protein